MTKKQRPPFILDDLIGHHHIEETILEEALAKEELIEQVPEEPERVHPEREHPGGQPGRSGRANRPPRNDPRHGDQSVLPGRDDMPAGSERRAPTGSS